MSNLLVQLKVPIPVDRVVNTPALIFTQWLPMDEKEAIVIHEDELEVKLRFDIQSTWWASQIEKDELHAHVNVLAHWVYADTVVKDISPELLSYIQTRDYSKPTQVGHEELQAQYDELAWRILSLSLHALNRLLSYVRSRWGQYWLLEREVDRRSMSSSYTEFEGKATTDCIDWFRFSPTRSNLIEIEFIEEKRFIKREDWQEVQSHVSSTKRPPLVKSVLARAELLASNGDGLSAIPEAVIALEEALHEFAKIQA